MAKYWKLFPCDRKCNKDAHYRYFSSTSYHIIWPIQQGKGKRVKRIGKGKIKCIIHSNMAVYVEKPKHYKYLELIVNLARPLNTYPYIQD